MSDSKGSGSKLSNSCIALFQENRVGVEKVLAKSIHYRYIWRTTWSFFAIWVFYLFYLKSCSSKITPIPTIQGCWLQRWNLFFLNPCSFQVIIDQSCQKMVYVGPISKAFFNTFFYSRGFKFFLKWLSLSEPYGNLSFFGIFNISGII